jgi:CARDB
MRARATESVCGSRLFGATLALALGTVLGVTLVAVLGAQASRKATSSGELSFRINHFQCYGVDPGSGFKPRAVTLVDQFGRSKAVASQLTALCAPVRKNGGAVRNARAHLVCYPIKSKPAFRSRKVVITNQFEKGTRLVVVRPNQLCVPTGKAVLPGLSPKPVKGLDHYQCYVVKPTRKLRERRVSLLDQFGKSRPIVVRMVSLCTPVRKNTVPIRNKRDHLVCYQLRSRQTFRARHVGIVNQFGKGELTVVSPERLCLPSLKRLNELPDLTVSIPNTRTQVSCPGGGGTCITTRDFIVTNASSVNVVTPFAVLVQADPGQKTTLSVPSLAAGASVTLSANLGPDNNCYDPDCTVSVTVDSGSAVAEANETNNVATRTDPG